MSSLRSKLDRLRFPNSGEPRPASDEAGSQAKSSPDDVAAHASFTELPSDPRQRLEALRVRIAGILTKAPPSNRLVPAPLSSELPFALVETSCGPLYVRTKRLSVAHRVGRASVQAGASASGGMLALLALDASLAQVDPLAALYIDTETTGLSGGTGTVPFLIGVAWFERETSALVLEQYLLRRLGDEAPMLERLATRVREASMLVSYNGKSFDVPLLRSRLVMNRLPELPDIAHLDLVHVARRLHRHRIPQLNLCHVEANVLGFVRTGDIAGSEVCSRYSHFLRTGDDSALMPVIDHNEWDIVALAALVGLYGEPLSGLDPSDWAFVARTVRRAGSLELASEIAQHAVARGAGDEAVRARGEIAKARGDKAQALVDFASLVETVDDPALRLALAKLYEHHAKEPLAALDLVHMGTGESAEATARRVERLRKKRDRMRLR